MKKTHLLFAAALLLSACVHKKEDNAQLEARFNSFKERFVEKYWELNPTAALYAGYHKYDSLLVIPYTANINKQTHAYESYLDSLKGFELAKLSGNNQIDFRMIENQLEAGVWYNTEFRSFEWNPSEYNVGGEFAQMISERYDQLDNRLRMLAIRLKKVPAFYQAAKENINNPTIEHTDLAILQNEGAVSVFGSMLTDSIAKSTLSENEKAAITADAGKAKAAIQDFINYLKTEVRADLKPETARSFRIGKDLYNKKFAFDIVSGYTAEQIYTKAIQRKTELHADMAMLSKQLWRKYFGTKPMPSNDLQLVRMMIDTLSHKHVQRDSLIASIKKQLPQLVDFISKKNLIYIDPAKPLVVRETPLYMQGVAGASISAPGPYEKNSNTYYNVTPLTNYTPEAAESYLREYNYYILQILNIHEAIPGHYTQLVYSNQSPSLIKSLFGNGAMVEGWAVYGERMMLENGYPNFNGKTDPEMQLMYDKWHLRSVCNTILDYSVHVLNISKEDAIKLLKEEAFQQQAEADGKWKRATLSQVQLCCYFTGYADIYGLRQELMKKQGSGFNLKQFHEQFLSYGSAPVKYIREMMLK